jgi:hypothetical protein
MYNTIDADNVARIIHEYEPAPTGQSVLSASSYLFTVKVVMAEGLVGADGHVHKMDPFLTLSDERGNRVAKTRTVYESASPTWNETFDISVKSSLWLAATIYKRNLMEKHDYIGRAFLHLNPKEFNDFLAHDLLLDLDTRGRVLLRVSMEGEKDDVQFHFGRAFRSLKRAETDMVRMIIDKVSSTSLSRRTTSILFIWKKEDKKRAFQLTIHYPRIDLTSDSILSIAFDTEEIGLDTGIDDERDRDDEDVDETRSGSIEGNKLRCRTVALGGQFYP